MPSVILLIAVLFLSACSSLLYYPSSDSFVDPLQLSRIAEAVSFENEDHVHLTGLYFSPKNRSREEIEQRPLIVQFHGNGENMTSHFLSLFWLVNEGQDFFIFDYQGYGQSDGKPTPAGTVKDGRAALRWAHARFPKRKLVVVGQSLGGAVAMRVVIDAQKTHEFPIGLVVVESTFDSYQEIGRDVLSRQWITWLFQPLAYVVLSDRDAPGDDIRLIAPTPLWVIHGDQDSIVPEKFGRRVFAKANEPKQFIEYHAPGHVVGFSVEHGKYREAFLNELKAMRGL